MRHSKIILGTSTILAASALTAAASQYVNPNIEGFQENSDTEEEINILYDTDTEDTSNAEVVTVADTDDTQVDSADPGGAVYVTLPIAADTTPLSGKNSPLLQIPHN